MTLTTSFVGKSMGNVVFAMTMSLDGFVNDRTGGVDRLYPDFRSLDRSPMMRDLVSATGAVVMGRHTFDMAEPDWYLDNYEFQVPIFVVTRTPPARPPAQSERLRFAFVPDVELAIERAKEAAGDKQVTVVGGPTILGHILRTTLVDVLQIAIMPVLLGRGLRLFENVDDQQIVLEKLPVIETGDRTDLCFKVSRKSSGGADAVSR
jgi:dihydrofolate reductase